MNERIKELAVEAFESIDYPYKQEINMPDILMEKFAELIVKECAETVRNRGGMCGALSYGWIKEHFGVEE